MSEAIQTLDRRPAGTARERVASRGQWAAAIEAGIVRGALTDGIRSTRPARCKSASPGFNLAYAVTHETFADVVAHPAPELRQGGVYRTDYAPGALQKTLFCAGPRLPDSHPAARHRNPKGAARQNRAAEE